MLVASLLTAAFNGIMAFAGILAVVVVALSTSANLLLGESLPYYYNAHY